MDQRNMFLEKPDHNMFSARLVFDIGLLPRIDPAYDFPLPICDRNMELSVQAKAATSHGCTTITSRVYTPRGIG